MTEPTIYASLTEARMALDAADPAGSFVRAAANVDFNDAQQTLAFLNPQLLRVEQGVYMVKYAPANYAEFMPVDTSGTVWSAGSIFFAGDVSGKPEWFDVAADDMPYANTSQSQFLQENHVRGIGFKYSQMDLERGRQLGQDVITQKADAAMLVAERDIHNIAMLGDGLKFTYGYVNDPLASQSIATANFSAMTPDQIVEAINGQVLQVEVDTQEAYPINQVVLPQNLKATLARRMGTIDGMSVLEYVKGSIIAENVTFKFTRHLNTAGAGGTRRMIVHHNSPETNRFHLPGGGYQFGDIRRIGDYSWSRPGIYATGGYENRIPKSKRMLDGI